MEHHDLLVEIFTEELPPKKLSTFEHEFSSQIENQLVEAKLTFDAIKSFSTPRRLAVLVSNLAEQQPTQKMEYRGPNVSVAYNAEKQLTPAGLGFLKKYNITPEQLSTISTEKGDCLYFTGNKTGLTVFELIPEIVKLALNKLSIN